MEVETGNLELLEQAFAYARNGKAHSVNDVRRYLAEQGYRMIELAQISDRALNQQLLAELKKASSQPALVSTSDPEEGGARASD